ncbi:BnaC04g02680D [Brassica napus]|uniref:BnaC04g02680D protein n=1 Tax=Brassica napus TaxID=3708 RepID=A0A078IWW1_BRANA|nr:BnaC04g02680D [Brassica napus]
MEFMKSLGKGSYAMLRTMQ